MGGIGGMHGRNVSTFQSNKVILTPADLFGVIAVFPLAHPLLNLLGQLRSTLDLYCADKPGLKGPSPDLLEVLYVDSRPVLMEGERRLTTCK